VSVIKSIGAFVQASVFGGTYDDLAFEIRVLKKEISTIHRRLDKELDAIRDQIDKLEGKPGKGRGRSRLQILGGSEIADIEHEAAPAAPAEAPPEAPPASSSGGLQTVSDGSDSGFHPGMTIAAAHRAHDGAADVFAAHHLPSCTVCPVSEFESVGDGAGDHGVNVAALVADLNRLVSA
jgi:hybrid cluster-associated redox disulfide protein